MLTDLELTILSMIAESQRTGAEIEALIEQRGLRDWLLVGQASLYYVLQKLERMEVIHRSLADDNAPVFSLTEAGRGVLQTAIADLLRQPIGLGERFELGLANVTALKPGQVYDALLVRRATLRSKLLGLEQALNNPADPGNLLYSHSLALARAEMTWLETFLELWLERYPALDEDAASTPEQKRNITQIHRRTAPLNPAKQMQRIPRPRPDSAEG
jgi:DNA-binding PadR family transcriptional regulator